MKSLHTIMITALLVVGVATTAVAQEDYTDPYIFGYLQAAYIDINASILGPHSTTFFLQQANLMVAKEFDTRFSSFLNLQFTNGYNSKLGWGAMNVEEGWVKYSHSSVFNIKGGFILPSFNALLRLKNRTPLLPYIVRPLVYEPLMYDRLNTEAFLPLNANVEVYGSIPAGPVDIEYAVFWGNSESNYIISGYGTGFQVSGMDTTTFKLWGGRLGVSTSWLRLGASFTTDKENQNRLGLGAVQRYRYGMDVNVQYANFSFDGEVILVGPVLDSRQTAIFSGLRAFNPMVGEDLDRSFFYGNLLWELNEALYAYVNYSRFQLNDFRGMDDGVKCFSYGVGWRPTENVVLKAQHGMVNCESPYFPLNLDIPIIAVSVMF